MRELFVGILFLLAACAPDAERNAPVEPVGETVDVVKGLMEAFNAHDPDAMRAYWHDDVEWIEISGDSASTVTASADQLRNELVVYFENFPTVSSGLKDIAVNGNFLTAVETPVWEEDGERKSQSSIVVYEFLDGKVKRFWYYPPQ
ncbi:MAG: nuclear transport factor 2 family protein [Pseudomonadota bacterium]